MKLRLLFEDEELDQHVEIQFPGWANIAQRAFEEANSGNLLIRIMADYPCPRCKKPPAMWLNHGIQHGHGYTPDSLLITCSECKSTFNPHLPKIQAPNH